MYTTADYLINRSTSPASDHGLALYNRALARGWLKWIVAALAGRNRALRHLPQAANGAQRCTGVQTISAARDCRQ
jgi:hypothetical protein